MMLCDAEFGRFHFSPHVGFGGGASEKAHHLPILVDPSHGTGKRRVLPLSRAAIAVGADGLLVEVHLSRTKPFLTACSRSCRKSSLNWSKRFDR